MAGICKGMFLHNSADTLSCFCLLLAASLGLAMDCESIVLNLRQLNAPKVGHSIHFMGPRLCWFSGPT